MKYEQYRIVLKDKDGYPDDCIAIDRACNPFWGRRTGETRDCDHELAEDEMVNISHYEKNGFLCADCEVWMPAAVQE